MKIVCAKYPFRHELGTRFYVLQSSFHQMWIIIPTKVISNRQIETQALIYTSELTDIRGGDAPSFNTKIFSRMNKIV